MSCSSLQNSVIALGLAVIQMLSGPAWSAQGVDMNGSGVWDRDPATGRQVPASHDISSPYERFVACVEATPCDHTTCLERYAAQDTAGPDWDRVSEIDRLIRGTKKRCAQQIEQKQYDALLACAANVPACDYVARCEDPYNDSAGSNARLAELAAKRSAMEGACKQSLASNDDPASGLADPKPIGPPLVPQAPPTSSLAFIPPSDAPPAPFMPTSGSPVVARTYWADIRFDKSGNAQVSAELLKGNCRDRRVKVVVDQSHSIGWEYSEATRTSVWVGKVDPVSGVVTVTSGNVRVFASGDHAVIPTPPAAKASGAFGDAALEFDPCGKGRLVVLN